MTSASELIGKALEASAGLRPLLDCRKREPGPTCALVAQTCDPSSPTQALPVQGAALRAIALLKGGYSSGDLEDYPERIEALCGDKGTLGRIDCKKAVEAGEQNQVLAEELLTEAAYTWQYLNAVVAARPPVHRGVALPLQHPLVERLRECESKGPASRCYGEVGTHYVPRALESWTTDEGTAKKFAREKAKRLGDSFRGIVITKYLSSPYVTPLSEQKSLGETAREQAAGLAAVPLMTSFSNRGCLFAESEVLVLWTRPTAPFPGTGEWEIKIEAA